VTSLRPELALAAARTRLLAERLPDLLRDELIAEWLGLLERIEDEPSDAAAVERVLAWREQRVEPRLADYRRRMPIEEVSP